MDSKLSTYDRLKELKEKINNKNYYFEGDNKELLRVLVVIAENLAELNDTLRAGL